MGHDEDVPEDGTDGSPISHAPRRSTFTPAPADAYERVFGSRPSIAVPTAPDQGSPAVIILDDELPSGTAGRSAGAVNTPPPVTTIVLPPPKPVLPRPPRRISLADEVLMTTLDISNLAPGASLDAIERFEHQLSLRDLEAREFRTWESSMLTIGTPEALNAIEHTRTAFTEVIQVIPASQPPATPHIERPVEHPEHPDEALKPVVVDSTEPDAAAEAAQSPVTIAFDAGTPTADSVDTAQGVAPTATAAAEAREGNSRGSSLTPEPATIEPTLPEDRSGRPARLFMLWFAANSSVMSLVVGGVLLSFGMSLRQAIVAALAGVALSFLPLGLATLASKWNGQPTMVVSRASFGLVGNAVPAVLSLVTRLFWGAVLLWFLATATAQILTAAGIGEPLTQPQLAIITAGVAFLVALVTAFFGYALVLRLQLVLSVVSGALILALIAITWPHVDIAAALTVNDGPWVLVLAGGILVFSFVGLVWSTSGGDLARYQRETGSGAASMLLAPLGNTLPAFALIGYGALLAASDDAVAFGFVVAPVETLASLVPAWFIVPLVLAIGLGLLSSVILSIYSGGFALLSLGIRVRREAAVIMVGLALAAAAVAMMLLALDINSIFRDLGTTLAVPTAVWAGIFCAEVMIRNRRFDPSSLTARGGVYPAVNWVNLSMLAVSTILGYGLVSASVSWLSWQGYLLPALDIPLGSDLAKADIGVLVGLVLGLLTPIIAGIRTIRRQEAAGAVTAARG